MNCGHSVGLVECGAPLATGSVIRVSQLYISPGHNFVGHHGGPPGQHPTLAMARVHCVAGGGIRGDRFFAPGTGHNRQITFFGMEVFGALQRELSLAEASPAATRRNVITQGIDLNVLIEQEFEIQGVRFFGVEECRPCHWMNQAFGDARVEGWLKGRGGLRARILCDGTLQREGLR